VATEYTLTDGGGLVRWEGFLTPDPASNAGVAYVTVIHAPPTVFVTALMFDDTASTGGLYAWTGSAYTKVGLATT
jgi:hypothetical protein